MTLNRGPKTNSGTESSSVPEFKPNSSDRTCLLLLGRLYVRKILTEEKPLPIGKNEVPADCPVGSIPSLIGFYFQQGADRNGFLCHAQADQRIWTPAFNHP